MLLFCELLLLGSTEYRVWPAGQLNVRVINYAIRHRWWTGDG